MYIKEKIFLRFWRYASWIFFSWNSGSPTVRRTKLTDNKNRTKIHERWQKLNFYFPNLVSLLMVQRKKFLEKRFNGKIRIIWNMYCGPITVSSPTPIENTSVLLYRCQMFVDLIFNLCNVEPMSLGWLGSAIWIIFCDAIMWAIKIIWVCLCENYIQSIVFLNYI